MFVGTNRRRKSWKAHGVVAHIQHTILAPERFPMYVMSLSELLAMEKLRPHQEIKSQLRVFDSAMEGKVIFLSHQWLGWSAPDPDNGQFQALKALLRRMMSGEAGDIEMGWMQQLLFKNDKTKVTAAELKAALPDMFVWIDYASMPQPRSVGHAATTADHRLFKRSKSALELIDAVHSIPSYVERSALIMVFAPPYVHADTGKACNYKSWRTRGWCRVEFVAALLACNDVRVIVAAGDTIEFVFPADALVLLAGEGEFTCCARDHDFGEGPGTAPCDKLKVCGVVETMIDAKIKHLHSQPGGRLEARWFVALRHWFLRGLPAVADEAAAAAKGAAAAAAVSLDEADARDLAALKRRLEWSEGQGPDPRTGATLLFWAAVADDLGATRALLKAGCAEVNLGLRKDVPRLSLIRGHTPLIWAMMVARFEVVEALLDAGADPSARDDRGRDAVMYASTFGRTDNLRRWLRRFPDWDLDALGGGDNALLSATFFGPKKASTVRLLLDAKADPRSTNNNGGTALINAAGYNQDADPEVLRVLLEAVERESGAGAVAAYLNHQAQPMTLKSHLLQGVARMAVYCGTTSELLQNIATWKGGTALHKSATNSDVEMCRLLLKAKADPTLRTALGQTPLDEARFLQSGGKRGEGVRASAPIEELFATLQQ